MRTCGRKCGASARWAGRKRPQRHRVLAQAVLQQAPPSKAHVDQHVRQGDTEAPYVAAQARATTPPCLLPALCTRQAFPCSDQRFHPSLVHHAPPLASALCL